MSGPAGAPSGRVVAELGRPETPEETAARQAESSRLYRERKTFPNLIWALIVSLVVVLAIVALVPRDDTPITRDVDVAQAAEQASAQLGRPVASPAVPEGWTANTARLGTGADGIVEWSVGYIVPDADGRPAQFAGISQGIAANPTWTLERTGSRTATGTAELAGRTWDEYDYTSLPASEAGNAAYALSTELDGATLVVYGSGSPETVRELAEAANASLGAS